MNYRESAIDLLEQQQASHVVSERERRERPLNIGALFYVRRKPRVIADDEGKTSGVRGHVLLDEFRELIRCPGFAFGIQHDDAIGVVERREQLCLLHVCDLQRQEMPDSTAVVVAQLRQRRIFRLTDPNHPQLHL